MRIAVDGMGGDNAPEVVLEGVAAALAADDAACEAQLAQLDAIAVQAKSL